MTRFPGAALCLAAVLCPSLARAQRAFEVASIKPVAPPIGIGRSGFSTNPGRLEARALSLKELIQQAYGVAALQVSGGPDWIATTRFDIEGKSEGVHSRKELLEMLQTLLADRFKLSFHRETKELPAAVLTVGKDAPKLERTAELQRTESGDPAIALRPQVASGITRLAFAGHRISLSYLANYISPRLDRVVVDRTGLSGEFDFNAEVVIDRNEAADPNVPEREIAARLYTDLVKALGLKLESQKAPVEVLVIDHAERPAEN